MWYSIKTKCYSFKLQKKKKIVFPELGTRLFRALSTEVKLSGFPPCVQEIMEEFLPVRVAKSELPFLKMTLDAPDREKGQWGDRKGCRRHREGDRLQLLVGGSQSETGAASYFNLNLFSQIIKKASSRFLLPHVHLPPATALRKIQFAIKTWAGGNLSSRGLMKR